jgi:integrase
MAGTVRSARLNSPTARGKLKRGRQPHWSALVTTRAGRAHLGWQRWPGDGLGRWLLRRFVPPGRYTVSEFGRADDGRAVADGVHVLSHEQAQAKALAALAAGQENYGRLTVRRAVDLYLAHKRFEGRSVDDAKLRLASNVLPYLGDLEVDSLTAEQLRKWLADLAATPALVHTGVGQPQRLKAPPGDDPEAVRRRRASANRVLSLLKAVLNFCYDEKKVTSNDAWGRRLKPFADVGAVRMRYLTVAEAQRLLNAADPDFRTLVRAGLETGCRFGELIRLQVTDFNPDAGTVAIRRSKSGRSRHVVLTDQGQGFFRQVTAGRAGDAVMFLRTDGEPWRKSNQARPMAAACARAAIVPACGFHQLRHTWASLAVMNGTPLMLVARNLGHVDTRMVEKHYGHLSQDYATDAIRKGAPRFGDPEPSNVVSAR